MDVEVTADDETLYFAGDDFFGRPQGIAVLAKGILPKGKITVAREANEPGMSPFCEDRVFIVL